MTSVRPGHTVITPAESESAIYIDYEASAGRSPTLLGVSVAGEIRVWVVEPGFHPCCGRAGTCRTAPADHTRCTVELVDRAEAENRLIVSWSAHDLRLMEPALAGDPTRTAILHSRFRDARFSGRRWMARQSERRQALVREQGHKLDVYRELFGIHQPERFGSGVAGDAMRMLRRQLAEGRRFGELTAKARESWHVLVRHNEFDLTTLELVCRRVSGEFERIGRLKTA